MSTYSWYIGWLLVGLASYMGFTAYCVYRVLKMAHDEDPGCLDPRH